MSEDLLRSADRCEKFLQSERKARMSNTPQKSTNEGSFEPSQRAEVTPDAGFTPKSHFDFDYADFYGDDYGAAQTPQSTKFSKFASPVKPDDRGILTYPPLEDINRLPSYVFNHFKHAMGAAGPQEIIEIIWQDFKLRQWSDLTRFVHQG